MRPGDMIQLSMEEPKKSRPIGRQGAGPYECPECHVVRVLKTKPRTRMCRKCAAKIGSDASAQKKTPLVDRLLAKRTITDSGCWEWGGQRQPTGYGSIYVEGQQLRTHRVSYDLFVGPIPENLHIDHLCRNTSCFNPQHLEPVTHAENMRRLRREQCGKGHAMTDDNIYVYRNKRHCKSCRRDRSREAWRARHGK